MKGWLAKHLAWKVGNGLQIRLWVDLWLGLAGSFVLTQDLRSVLEGNGLVVLGDCGSVGDCDGVHKTNSMLK